MEFSEDWKRLWPISSVFSPPLLNNQTSLLGPLFFNPSPSPSPTPLFSSPSHLSPNLTPPFPNLTLKRFLFTSSSSPLPYSTSSSIISENTLTPSHYQTPQNRDELINNLQLLTCPFSSRVYVFLPAGENLEKVGILVVFVDKDSNFEVKHNRGKPFFVENNVYQHRIMRLLINPLSSDCFEEKDDEGFVRIAYLVACCKYCVFWYSVKVRKDSGSGSCCPVVECVGSKWFRSSSVVYVCWSPHLVEECVVMLENGEVFLFDLGMCSKGNKLVGKKLGVLWDIVGDEGLKLEGGNVWLGCEFSWHPRILVVAHSSRVFLVDMRSRDFKVRSLLDIDVSVLKNNAFVALSMAGTDGFRFVVASKELLLLCDVRIPKRPLLRWVHGLESPNHINVLKLSELRSNSSDETYDWASKSGYCILLGSFWDGEFNIFCYGPDYGKAPCLSNLPKVNNHFSAWGLPSDISLSGRGCHCGTCLVREEFSKEALHRWIDWRQKKELVMGFGFVKSEITSQLSGPDNFGGFHLIRLMSSGKLEVQRYSAAWKLEHISEKAHKESIFDGEDNHFYDICEPSYDVPKRHQFLTLANMKRCLADNETPDSYRDFLDGFAVNLGDDTEDFDFKTPIHAERPGVNHSNMRSNPEKSPPVTSTNRSSASNVKKEAVGPELFDEGCPYDLKFNDHGIELGQQGLQMSNWLVTHKFKFKESLKS